jgi:NAD(P)-dependent dehydrogenase (short-subunit alcohol dehydrogenase family)
MMMKNLALEWGHYGIRINSIVPGPIEGTEGLKRLSSAEAKQILIDAVPMRRMGTVDDIGQTAAFLASPLASYSPAASLSVMADQISPVRGGLTRVPSRC